MRFGHYSPHLLEECGVEAEHDINSEYAIDNVVEDEHAPACVLPEGNPPWNDHHAIHDHHAYKGVPVQLPRVLRLYTRTHTHTHKKKKRARNLFETYVSRRTRAHH